jgi:hypothetical protein
MQATFQQTFLALYLAHLATDFVFQSARMVDRKKRGDVAGYAWHGAIHLAAAVGTMAFIGPASLRSLWPWVVIAALTAVHLLVDRAKVLLVESRLFPDGLGIFVADQAVHAGTVLAAALLIAGMPFNEFLSQSASLQLPKEKILWVVIVYVAVIWGGGYLIRSLTQPLLRPTLVSPFETLDELENAGTYIGWLERFLVLTALALQSPATVGLILTAKSIARFPEFKSVRFAQYFLIGTLLSVSVGILGGLVLLQVLYGTVHVSK